MGEEVKGVAIILESLLKKRKRNEEWALAKKEAEQAQTKKNYENRKLIFKRAEQYVKEYSDNEKELVQLKRDAKMKGGFYVPLEAKLLFIIRIRGINAMDPKTKSIMQLLRFRCITSTNISFPANTNTKNLPTAKKLILMKTGGHIIYSGPLGQHSSRIIKYFEGVAGVQKIKDNYNPATWMENTELVTNLCFPPPGSKDLHFRNRFPQTGWALFKACLWKQHLSYWRSHAYNLTRILHVTLSSLLFGLLFFKQGNKINSQQDLFTIFGFTFTATIFIGLNNCTKIHTQHRFSVLLLNPSPSLQLLIAAVAKHQYSLQNQWR